MQFRLQNVSERSIRQPVLEVETHRRSLYKIRRIYQISGVLEKVQSLKKQLERYSTVEVR